jgi:hypothetical protein
MQKGQTLIKDGLLFQKEVKNEFALGYFRNDNYFTKANISGD